MGEHHQEGCFVTSKYPPHAWGLGGAESAKQQNSKKNLTAAGTAGEVCEKGGRRKHEAKSSKKWQVSRGAFGPERMLLEARRGFSVLLPQKFKALWALSVPVQLGGGHRTQSLSQSLEQTETEPKVVPPTILGRTPRVLGSHGLGLL